MITFLNVQLTFNFANSPEDLEQEHNPETAFLKKRHFVLYVEYITEDFDGQTFLSPFGLIFCFSFLF